MQEEIPKVSIITPTYNAQNDIESCILSVANQSYKNIEHIIIDGLSTDKTLEIVKKYAKKYSHIKIISERDKGIYDAMNKGIDLSSGSWIYFLGSDDLLFRDNVLEDVFAKNDDHNLFDFLYGDVMWGDTQRIYDGKFSTLKLTKKNICHQAIFCRKELFSKFGKFDLTYKVLSDWAFNLKMFGLDDVRKKYINIVVARYTIKGFSSYNADDLFMHNQISLIKDNLPEDIELIFDIKGMENELLQKDKELQKKDSDIEKKVRTIQLMNEENSIKDKYIQTKIQELDLVKSQLDIKFGELSEIHRSRGWRLVILVRKIMGNLFPRGSVRRKMAIYLFRALEKLPIFLLKIRKLVSYHVSLLKRALSIIKRDGLFAFAKKVFGKLRPRRYLKKPADLGGERYSFDNQRYFEEQQDYSEVIKHKSIKILSYYLPQFHPIPENDKWHGKGFTEWHNVMAASELFRGHYQPHVPHIDIGYYLLDSPDVLKKQAGIMKKAGVFGQVFYHYWFTGKLILEGPAQMLLKNKDIDMPFCFCWANENWTKKWDGNDKEVLLKQDYSKEDALGFIRYLIPFFKDKRYITIDKRPVLFIYRPTSFPDFILYKKIWADECDKNGVRSPYIVATLTRGATSPTDYGMDAGIERVLHDWTDGNVPEMKQTLMQYDPMNGSVLNYDDVAKYYMNQNDEKPFRYFRSIVPIWDNTARYGDRAQLLHGSTPARFQEWLKCLIRYSESSLPKDKQIITVNAWNEWAEGAHLEPDKKFGYAYLNSVGRALGDIPFGDVSIDSLGHKILGKKNAVKIVFTMEALKILEKDVRTRRNFIACLAHSTIFDLCEVSISDDRVVGYIKAMDESICVGASGNSPYDYEILISSINYFGNDVLERLLRMGIYNKASVICVNNPFCKRTVSAHFPELWSDGDKELFPIRLHHKSKKQLNKYEVCCSAVCSMKAGAYSGVTEDKPIVTTIVRFHKGSDFGLLNNALLSLLSQADCIVQPLIAVQDLSDEQMKILTDVVNQYPWDENFKPIISRYHSNGKNTDLRSRMLNESLFSVETKYAAFLDFDDVLYPFAYKYLIGRLISTKKAVTFGNVFTTIFNRECMKVIKRNKVYEYGSDYQNFISDNHAPLHSFMFDLERLDLSDIKYFEDMKFMEDYYLTLQIFAPDNVDWESLKLKNYIGEYIHSVDSKHTLAIVDEKDRQGIIQDKLYVLCEKRIKDLRNRMRLRFNQGNAAR